jgi:peptidoglycan/LPS O-acetylase OafA/YrhL
MPFELAGSYLVYAGLALFGGLRRRWIIYALGGALVALTCHRFLLDIVIGIALCDLYVTNAMTWRRTLGLASALALVALAVFVIPWKPVAATMVVVAVAGSPRLQELLNARWLAWLGRTSFGLYLIHMPILCSVSCGLFNWLSRDQGWEYVPAAIAASVVGLAVVYAGAWLFWLLVDNPALALPRWLEGKIFRPKPADATPATLPMSKAA